MSAPDHITLPDGRRLEYRVSGPADGFPLLYHHGTPGSAVPMRFFERAAEKRGLRLITASRSGYGGSERHAGRAIVDVVADSEALLKALGYERCIV